MAGKSALEPSHGIDIGHILSSVPSSIGIMDVRAGRYVYISPGVRYILGYSPEEVLEGGPAFMAKIVHPEDLQPLMKAFTNALKDFNRHRRGKKSKPVRSVEYRSRHRDGRYRWLRTEGSAYARDADGKVTHVLYISSDITDRKLAEEQLAATTRKLEEKATERGEHLEIALDATHTGTWEVNLQTKELRWSQQALQLCGLPVDEPVTFERFMAAVHPEDRALIDRSMESAIKHGTGDRVEHRVIWPDGSVHWVLVQGKSVRKNGIPVKIIGTTIDIDELKKTQLERAASEERLNLALNGSKMGTWEWNVATDTLIWSAQLYKLFGISAKQPITYKRYLQALHKDDRDAMQAIVQNAMKTGKSYRVEHRVIWPDGSAHWILGQGKAYLEKGKVVRMAGTVLNIDEQVRARERLAESEARLNLALRSSGMGIWEWDLRTKEIIWSNQMRRIYGVKSDVKITYKLVESLQHPEEQAETHRKLKEAIDHGRAFNIEYRVIHPDGTHRWVQIHGKAIYEAGKAVRLIGTAADIHERKTAELRLQESEERFRNLADNAPVLIWVSDADRNVTYVNRTWLEYTGRHIKHELGTGWRDRIHPDDKERVQTTGTVAVKARRPFSFEYRLRRHDGVYRWMLADGIPRLSATGEFQGYIGTAVDIDDIKRAVERRQELEVRAATLAAEREQLMALNQAKDEFISLASHQLRTPATGVKQYVGMVLGGYAGKISSEQQIMLAKAYESNEREIQIINSLLLVARVDAGKVRLLKKPNDLAALVRDVVHEQSPEFEKRKQTVNLDVPPSLIVKYDQEYMRMVIDNLINNASKYSYEGQPIKISLKKQLDTVALSIADQGVGIAKKDQQRLYQKFSRIDNPLTAAVEGNGLGLYWTKRIIDLHGGELSLSSKLGKGSIFTVTLPLPMPSRPHAPQSDLAQKSH
jgi:PAS domain S-box-containing protein